MDLLKQKLEEDEKKAKKDLKSAAVLRTLYIVVFSASLLLIFLAGAGIPICIGCLFMLGIVQANYNKYKKSIALIQDYRLYAKTIADKQSVTAEELSTMVCQPMHVILANLKEMIQKGYILKVEKRADYYRYAYIENTAIRLPDAQPRVMVQVTCDACGGVTEIPKGESGKCVYCDSKIQG